MALESQLVNVNFAGGMDEKTSDRYVVQGKLRSLKNGRFRKVGEISKRFGNTLTASANESLDMTPNARLGAFENELLVFDKYTDGRTFCSSYSAKTGQFEKMGVSSEAVMTLEDAHFDSAYMYQHDWAKGNSTIVTVWSNAAAGSNGSIYYMIRDYSTGTMIVKPTTVNGTTTYRKPRVIFCDTTCIITCQNGANIVAFTIDPTTLAISAGSNIRTDNLNYGDYDICGGASVWALAYQKTGGGADLKVYTYNSALTQQATGTSAYTPTVGPSTKLPISCSLDSGDLWVVFVDQDAGSATYEPVVTWFNSSTLAEAAAPITGADTVSIPRQATIVGIDSSRCAYAVEIDSASGAGATDFGNNRVYFGSVTRSGTTLTNTIPYTSRFLPWCSIGSRMFTESIVVGGGRAFMVGVIGTATADNTYLAGNQVLFNYSLVLIDPKLTSNDSASADIVRPVAICSPRSALWDRIAQNSQMVGPCSVIATTNGLEVLCRTRVGNGSWVSGVGYRGAHGLSSARINFSFTNKFQGVTFGELSCFSGGMNSFYDGRSCAEIGFVGTPDVLGDGGVPGGGALNNNGAYAWVACYVFYDERGNVHRSGVSLPFLKTIGVGNTSYSIRVPNLLITQTNDAASSYLPRVGIELYRTAAGVQSGPFYLVTPTPVAMDTTFRYTTINDTYSDSTIGVGSKIYTTGDIVENQIPPSFLSMVAHRGRLFGIDGKRVWFSKQLVAGEGPAFADEFTLDFDADLQLTALGSLDDKVIIFSKNTIHVLTGRGPTDTTAGNDYEITRLTTDRGCIEPRSIVTTPMGLMFQSAVGIQLLTRGLEVQYIGAEMQDTLAAYPYITSATVHPTEPVIYFTCNQSATGGTGQGVRIVYDYDFGQWSYDALWCRAAGSTSLTQGPVMSAVLVDGTYYWQDGRGYVYSEVTDGSKYYDDGSLYVVTEAQLAPINLNGINGFQRARYVQLKVKDYTSPSLTFEGYSDDEAVASTSQTFTPAVGEMRVDVTNQLASTFRILLRDAQNGSLSTGKGISFVGISFEVGVHPRANRLAAANRKG